MDQVSAEVIDGIWFLQSVSSYNTMDGQLIDGIVADDPEGANA